MDAILRFGMDYGHRNALQQAQGHKTLLVVAEAVVFERESGTLEYPPCASFTVYSTCIYVKACGGSRAGRLACAPSGSRYAR